MLSEQEIQDNKNRFLSLLRSVEREGMEKDLLIKQLEKGDFFTAPASTIYHNSCKGGLCAHCLNVYDNLIKLVEMKYTRLNPETGETISAAELNPYSETTLILIALLHDFAKMNYYESYVKNQKVYSDAGSKHDEMGKFDWVATSAYKVKDASERFLYGNHEYTSVYMINRFVPLSLEEEIAVSHHHAMMSDDCAKDNISAILNKYPLALLLHTADMLATFFDESV